MNETLLLYEVKPNETLSSIAERIGMTENQLRDFHNSNCGKLGLLFFNNFIGIQKLVIPKDYKSPEKIWNEISEKLPSKIISEKIYAEKYLVKETFEQIGDEKIESEFSFNIKLKNEKGEWIAEIIQTNFITNNETPDKKTSSIGLACMEAISPIFLQISEKGGVLGASKNQNSESRFKNKRKDIEEFFTDEISKEYLNQFQEQLVNEKFILHHLCTTLFYQLIFPKLELFWIKETFNRQVSIILNSFPVDCKFSPKYEITENGINIKFQGVIVENCTLSELLQNIREDDEEVENSLRGEVNFNYIYNSKIKQIINAEAEILLRNDEDLYIKHQIKISQYE